MWSLPCFFIKAKDRGQGVATALLTHAIAVMKKRRAKVIEGYPVRPRKPGGTPRESLLKILSRSADRGMRWPTESSN